MFFSVRSGEKEAELLGKYGFSYSIIGKKRKSPLGKLFGIIVFSFRILLVSRKNGAQVYISHGSMYAGIASFLRRKPHIALEDSGNMEQLRLSIPVSSVILSPDILGINLGKKQITYRGYHEIAYLCNGYYTPEDDPKVLLGIIGNKPYCILRFSAWGASHDINQKGLGKNDKQMLINFLSDKLKVFISSEEPLPEEYRSYEFPLPADKMHDAIAGADIVVSEGATIAAEAGVLGIPSIYINSIERCYNEDMAKYELVHNFRQPEGVLNKVKEILANPNFKSDYQARRKKMLMGKIILCILNMVHRELSRKC